MKHIALFISFLLLSIYSSADCIEYVQDSIEVSWTAFKTPEKVGVGGSFPDYKLSGITKGNSLKDILTGTSIEINSLKPHTKNSARDKKIAKFFFSSKSSLAKTTANITKVSSKKLTMSLNFGGKKRDVPMNYEFVDNTLKANGVIDVLDFDLSAGLKAINKACYALHQGKTWSDVNIALVAKFKSCKK